MKNQLRKDTWLPSTDNATVKRSKYAKYVHSNSVPVGQAHIER